MTDFDDAFSSSAKAYSWKDAKPGDAVEGRIVKRDMRQSRDYTTEEPAFWPDGKPKMQGEITLENNGELVRLIAKKPSSMWASWQKAAEGGRLADGGWLRTEYTGDGESKDPKLRPPKLFVSTYKAPEPSNVGEDDLF